MVKPESGRRNHVFYVGEPVSFKLDGKRLDRYEVRDYWGQMIDKGPATEQINIKAGFPAGTNCTSTPKSRCPKNPRGNSIRCSTTRRSRSPSRRSKRPSRRRSPGRRRRVWGDIVGGTTFVIFRRDPHFPDMPGVEVSGGSNGVLEPGYARSDRHGTAGLPDAASQTGRFDQGHGTGCRNRQTVVPGSRPAAASGR